MQTIKLTAHIDRNHRMEIQLPVDAPEGDAQVIVLIPSKVPSEALRRRHLEALLHQSAGNGDVGRSAADIDRQLAEERNAWGK